MLVFVRALEEGPTGHVRCRRVHALRALVCVAHQRPSTWKAPCSASDTPDFPKIPLLSLDPEQRKSPAGIPPFPAPHVVQIKTQSGELDKVQHRASQNTQHCVVLCRIHHNLRDMAWSTGGPLSRKNGAKLRCGDSRLSGTRHPCKPLSYYRCFQRRWSQNQ